MFKKLLLLITIFLVTIINLNAQNKLPQARLTCNIQEKRPKCDQPMYPKGAYYQNIENYSSGTGTDSLIHIRYIISETSVILNFKKRKRITMLVRQCSPNCTYPNPYKYLLEKKGSWKMQMDTVVIIWKYHKDALPANWLRLKNTDTLKLKYERDYKTNYPIIDCRSALIPDDKNLFTGYGN